MKKIIIMSAALCSLAALSGCVVEPARPVYYAAPAPTPPAPVAYAPAPPTYYQTAPAVVVAPAYYGAYYGGGYGYHRGWYR
jgi:hypothetical protein